MSLQPRAATRGWIWIEGREMQSEFDARWDRRARRCGALVLAMAAMLAAGGMLRSCEEDGGHGRAVYAQTATSAQNAACSAGSTPIKPAGVPYCTADAPLAIAYYAVHPDAWPAVLVWYSPADNLEAIDGTLLSMARERIDLVLYALDDEHLADWLITEAHQKIRIRLYRDQQQYLGEKARALKHGRDLNAELRAAGVEIRVKGTAALAHLKSYCIDCLTPGGILRDGSANWSVQGEKVQDNSLVVIRDARAQEGFERNFERLWSRENNAAAE